ncbi:uncharacterized protein [Haliotis asinina]|uniref:uncharacterized protein n=1 Tax=Haliotis asinina TaxID=109174 RepID=UPI003531D054
MKTLQTEGMIYHGATIKVILACVICDTPARAFVKRVKGHSGYGGCDRCTQNGEWLGKIIFPETDAPLRTDVQFDEMTDDEHHLPGVGKSLFTQLSVGMVSRFPLDYMHLVCLGVTKKLLMLWMKGPVGIKCRIGSTAVNLLSEIITSYSSYIPREFHRKGRSLRDIDRWKATEYRLFLLYTGPVALSSVLSPVLYRNFLLFVTGITCLISPKLSRYFCDYAQELLCLFVHNFADLYGRDMLVYNVHALVHLSDDVKNFGPLDNFSAFAFESYLGEIKKMLRTPNQPLQQVIRRFSEKQSVGHPQRRKTTRTENENLRCKHTDGPLLRGMDAVTQYKEIQTPDIFISRSRGDNCVNINDEVCIIRNLILQSDNEKTVIYEKFIDKKDFFTYPLSSSNIGVYKVSQLSRHLEITLLRNVKNKYVLLPKDNEYIALPLLHREN